jgi:hypothetical protein
MKLANAESPQTEKPPVGGFSAKYFCSLDLFKLLSRLSFPYYFVTENAYG